MAEELQDIMHEDLVQDTGVHFVIDKFTREIKTSQGANLTLIQLDHNSERFTFKVPRYIDGHDMSECNKVEIHYINIATGGTNRHKDVYPVTDLHIDPDDQYMVLCSWLVSRNATRLAGSLNFVVHYACMDGEIVDYSWHTGIYKGLKVGEGIDNIADVIEQNSDALEEWKQDLIDAGLASVESVNQARDTAIQTIQNHTEAEKQDISDAAKEACDNAALDLERARKNQVTLAESQIQAASEDARDAAVSDINMTKRDAVWDAQQQIARYGAQQTNTAISNINTAGNKAVSDVNDVKDTALTDISAAKDDAVGEAKTEVNAVKDTAVDAILAASADAGKLSCEIDTIDVDGVEWTRTKWSNGRYEAYCTITPEEDANSLTVTFPDTLKNPFVRYSIIEGGLSFSTTCKTTEDSFAMNFDVGAVKEVNIYVVGTREPDSATAFAIPLGRYHYGGLDPNLSVLTDSNGELYPDWFTIEEEGDAYCHGMEAYVSDNIAELCMYQNGMLNFTFQVGVADTNINVFTSIEVSEEQYDAFMNTFTKVS